MYFFIVATTCLISSAFAASYGSLRVKHAWDAVPRQWQEVGQPSPDELITLSIGLKQHQIESLITQLYDISDPDSPSYGDHLTRAEVDVLIAPDADTTAAVNDWLASNEIDPTAVSRSNAGDWVDLTVTIAKAEEMLGTTYRRFRHRDTATHVVRALSYALPEELHDAVDVVLPTTEFVTSETSDTRKMRTMLEKRGSLPDTIRPAPSEVPRPPPGQDPTLCSPFTTPDCLSELYGTANYVPNATDRNKLGVVGYLEQTFFSQFFPQALGSNFTYTSVNGGLNDQNRPRVEANLDIQYSTSLSFPTPNIYYSVGGRPPFIPDASTPENTNEPYIEWLRYILSHNDIPQTFTTSYAEPEQTVPLAYALRVCNTFAQLGARGSSVLFATGDFGVGNSDPVCKTNDGFNRTRFQPFFPASCPYVTAVGGTTGAAPEVAAELSGGGFSRYFLRPVYQFSSVSGYLSKIGNRYAGLYNPLGRAYPDVSAHATDYLIVVGGWTGAVDGTSASTPTFAAVVSLLNDFRLASGKKPLGFLNPLLYSTLKSGLIDIRSGNNPGCGTLGFNATDGWDPVTGLGTPNFPLLKSLIGQLR